jgi:hypothetical protein
MSEGATFERLDFIYMPSTDVAEDVRYFTEVLGGSLVFAVEGMGTRVAMVEVGEESPRLLLAGHLEGERPVLVYRVASLKDTLGELEGRGWEREGTFRTGRCARSEPLAATGSRSTS